MAAGEHWMQRQNRTSMPHTLWHNHLHQAGINIHKHTRPLAQVNFLGIHALLIVWCVNIYLYTLQIPRSIHLAHNFPCAPNVERDTITHTECLPHPQTKIHSVNERATGERQRENTQTYKDKFTQTCIHTPQTQIHEQKSLVHHTHTRNTHASREI